MSQATANIANMSRTLFRSAINSILQAIQSLNGGDTEPTEKYPHMWWPDETTGLLKQRNTANTGWVVVGTLDASYLGLGSLSAKQSWGKPQRPYYTNTDTATGGGSFSYDGDTKGQVCLITLTGAGTVTMAAPGNIVEGSPYTFIFKSGDTSARAFAWNAAYQNTPPSSGTQLSGKCDSVNFIGGASNTMIFNGYTPGA